MIHARLLDHSGNKIHHVFAIHLTERPEVLIWRDRIFVHDGLSVDDLDVHLYREVDCYKVPS